MALNVKSVSDMFGRDVFTTNGEYYGKVADVKVDLDKFRVKSLVVQAARGTQLATSVGNKKGVIIPYQMVQSVGDIVIVKHIAGPIVKEEPAQEAAPLPF